MHGLIVTLSLDGNGPAVLRLTPQLGSGGTVIRLSGELDIATADHLPRFVATLSPEDCRWVHLDLAGLAFIDAAGLAALVRANLVVDERSGRMTVGRPRPLARRLIELTALPLTVVDNEPERDAVETQTG
jgi:anti-anti-sigma factor